LGIIALFIDERKVRISFRNYCFGTFLGKNFPALTDFFIDYVPMYNKFRAVSSIQVILELCFPVLAIMGLQSFLNWIKKCNGKRFGVQERSGTLVILFLSKSMFSFQELMMDTIVKVMDLDLLRRLKETG
jgi:hypothetical protein